MVESKTINNKSEIDYYRVFGWHKVGEYHGAPIGGNAGLVDVNGKVMQKVRTIDEYYLRRDTADQRYKELVTSEKEFIKFYNLAETTSARAEKFIARKTRKFAVITFGIIMILSILAMIATAVFAFFPQFIGFPAENVNDMNWFIQMAVVLGICFVVMIICCIILHCNKSKTARKLPNYYKKRWEDALAFALKLTGIVLPPEVKIVPLKK